ncbi:MAG: hypothetical protein QOF78_1582 [Phycisphaerales bacterium]|jgi:RNA polymerase sigma factor (sigma-70 family)|nr:hypothetical protein [Phycisphaerales bacterium]
MDDVDDDSRLLHQFIATRDEPSFAALVRRYVDLVYSAARRQMRDDAAAQDVTQHVFVLLADKARAIRNGEALAGWLLVTTRFVALNTLRSEARRRRHEREAAVMHENLKSQGTPAWEQVGPMLDEAVGKLKREDRDALALRYFQGRSVADVAAVLGVSHEAAQKRLGRAVEKLRELFARRGVHTSADALSSALMANALILAPAALGTSVAGTALSAAASAAASGSTKGLVAIMAAANTKVVAASVAAVLLIGVTGTITYKTISTPGGSPRQVRVAPADAAVETPVPTQPANPNWQAAFESVYLLKPNEIVKRVPRPWIAERFDYYRTNSTPTQVNLTPKGPDVFVVEQFGTGPANAAGLRMRMMTFGGSGKDVRDLLRDVVGVSPEEVDLPASVKSTPLHGDWVVRAGSTIEARMTAFASVMSQVLGRTYQFKLEPREREAIVITGTYAFHPLPDTEQQPGGTMYLTVKPPARKPGFYAAGGSAAQAFERVGALTGLPIIFETKLPEPGRGVQNWRIDVSANPYLGGGKPMDAATIDALLANVAKQTSLVLKREKRVVPTWVSTAP